MAGVQEAPGLSRSVGKLAAALSKLTESEEGFLSALSDLQPLVILASFSLVIGTFAGPLSPTAAGYAIGASMAFLTGFILLLARKAFIAIVREKVEPDVMLLAAYGSIGVGLVLLYFVPAELVRVIPNIGLYLGLPTGVVFAVAGLATLDSILAGYKRTIRLYPGRTVIGPVFAMSGIGILLTFGSLALLYAVPTLSIGLFPTLAIATFGAILTAGSLLALFIYLKIRLGGVKPPP